MKQLFLGNLFNKSGIGHYKTPDAVENLIRYITRTNNAPKSDLIVWGGVGIVEFSSIDSIISQFELVQELHERNISISRFINHEIFSFSIAGENLLAKSNTDLKQLAWEMAFDYYDIDHCQVVFGVHSPDENNKHLHIHFAINAFDLTGHKRHETMNQIKEREDRFQKIIAAKIQEALG